MLNMENLYLSGHSFSFLEFFEKWGGNGDKSKREYHKNQLKEGIGNRVLKRTLLYVLIIILVPSLY